MQRVDASSDGQLVTLAVGEELQLSLPERPTTGYRWRLESDGSPACAVAGDRFEPESQLAGAGGVRTWVLRAVAPGQTQLSAVSARSWGASPPAATFQLRIAVTQARP